MPSSTPGQRLRTGRIKLRKHQTQVAKECHKALSTYKSWEQERARPKTFEDIINVCEATGISVQYYIAGVEIESELPETHQRALDSLSSMDAEYQDILIRMLEDMAQELAKNSL